MKEMFIFLLIFQLILCLDNNLGKTPPMGWNSWKKFGCNINEKIIIETIDKIVERGLLKLGYKYITIDDCWQKERDEKGFIKPDPIAFPNGIKYLADYAHSKGLLLGLLSSSGEKTCMKRPGSYGYEENDVLTFVEWGIDYLKFVECGSFDPVTHFSNMSSTLLKAKRPIFYSINEWGKTEHSKWERKIANSWRTTTDIMDSWTSMLQNIDKNNQIAQNVGPGEWKDPDVLVVGNGGMNYEEYKTHFSLWAISKAPLIISCDITKMSDETYKILSNEEIIAINQDPLGIQGEKIKTNQSLSENEDNLSENKDIILARCDGTDRQKWVIRNDGSIRNPDGEICLEIPRCHRGKIQLQTSRCHIGQSSYCESSLNQDWSLEEDGTISSRMEENKCLNVFDFSSNIIQVDKCNLQGSKGWDYSELSKTIGFQGKCLTRASIVDSLEVWTVLLSDNSYAVLLLNRGKNDAKMIARWSEIGIQGKYAIVRDLWAKKDVGIFSYFFETNVGPHSSKFLKIKSANPKSSNVNLIDILNLAFISLIIIQVIAFSFWKINIFKIFTKKYINVNVNDTEVQELKNSNNN